MQPDISLRLTGDSLGFPPSLERIRSVLSFQEIVPPAKAARVVADELLMMKIMMIRTGPEGEEVVETPRELITTVRVDGLEQAQHNPDVHCEDVQVAGEGAPEDRASDSTETKNHDLDRRRVFGRQAERSRVLMVNFMDRLVKRTPVKSTVREIVPGVLHHKENGDLVGHSPEGRKWNRGREAEELGHRMEEPASIMST